MRPQSVTHADLLHEYWMERLVEEQEKTNALLEKLLLVSTPVAEEPKKSRLTRKKKEGE